ncbi:DUF4145 domain-containing protein [Pseudoalteromonas arctica]|uniref:DUF4145 domain-containing protein n=1 Tax=Pseudoalteromonas arctica A 37-1-2 TaxID=1117313 RepID=A0A290SA84_9GAMM|nr:DUF4145 domain-containing protein [Pseudoalteromonas arctica]ATC88972.1 hypothetical protein PARC_b0814 [Pseudoalteromonas arctica A 37-1-2]
MSLRINLENGTQAEIDKEADICPICDTAQIPVRIFVTITGELEKYDTKLEIVMKCMNSNCARLYIAQYIKDNIGFIYNKFKFNYSFPKAFKAPDITKEITDISQSFRKIFIQASEAESKQLDELAGIGYRKALEYLIKDYCISIKPDKEEDIKSNQLSRVINNYVTDENLKSCANRAVWLGNDETHYIRKWENHDLKDLKILIQLTCTWIQSSILTKKYMDEMSRD